MAQNKSLKLTSTLMLALGIFFLAGNPTQVYAIESDSASVTKVIENVYEDVEDKDYNLRTGELVKGKDIIKRDGTVTDTFNDLSEGDKTEFMGDVDKSVSNTQQKDIERVNDGGRVVNQVTDGTVSEFWKEFRAANNQTSGYLITSTTSGIQADLRGATDLLAPVFPFMNTAIGVFIIIAAISLFLYISMDMVFFFNPYMQYVVLASEGKEGVRGAMTAMVTPYAKKAVQDTEDGKNPLWKYIAHTWLLLLLYSLILVFFASNSMLVLVGPITSFIYKGLGFQ